MRRLPRLPLRLTLAAMLALLATGAVAGPSIAADKWVTMYALAYLPPGPVTIEVGDTVTWVNDDDAPHDAVGNGWTTPLLTKGDSHAVTFIAAGTYAYYCSIHPEMTGRVVVRAAAAAGNPPPPTDTEPLAGRAGAPSGSATPFGIILVSVATAGAFVLGARRRSGGR